MDKLPALAERDRKFQERFLKIGLLPKMVGFPFVSLNYQTGSSILRIFRFIAIGTAARRKASAVSRGPLPLQVNERPPFFGVALWHLHQKLCHAIS